MGKKYKENERRKNSNEINYVYFIFIKYQKITFLKKR